MFAVIAIAAVVVFTAKGAQKDIDTQMATLLDSMSAWLSDDYPGDELTANEEKQVLAEFERLLRSEAPFVSQLSDPKLVKPLLFCLRWADGSSSVKYHAPALHAKSGVIMNALEMSRQQPGSQRPLVAGSPRARLQYDKVQQVLGALKKDVAGIFFTIRDLERDLEESLAEQQQIEFE